MFPYPRTPSLARSLPLPRTFPATRKRSITLRPCFDVATLSSPVALQLQLHAAGLAPSIYRPLITMKGLSSGRNTVVYIVVYHHPGAAEHARSSARFRYARTERLTSDKENRLRPPSNSNRRNKQHHCSLHPPLPQKTTPPPTCPPSPPSSKPTAS